MGIVERLHGTSEDTARRLLVIPCVLGGASYAMYGLIVDILEPQEMRPTEAFIKAVFGAGCMTTGLVTQYICELEAEQPTDQPDQEQC